MSQKFRTSRDVFLSVTGGFVISFLGFAIITLINAARNMQGQLVAGDTELNRELPTTLNAMRAAADGSDPIMAAMTHYTWWVAVIIGGIIASVVLFKLMRRYV